MRASVTFPLFNQKHVEQVSRLYRWPLLETKTRPPATYPEIADLGHPLMDNWQSVKNAQESGVFIGLSKTISSFFQELNNNDPD